jgi:hypothetical protein
MLKSSTHDLLLKFQLKFMVGPEHQLLVSHRDFGLCQPAEQVNRNEMLTLATLDG